MKVGSNETWTPILILFGTILFRVQERTNELRYPTEVVVRVYTTLIFAVISLVFLELAFPQTFILRLQSPDP